MAPTPASVEPASPPGEEEGVVGELAGWRAGECGIFKQAMEEDDGATTTTASGSSWGSGSSWEGGAGGPYDSLLRHESSPAVLPPLMEVGGG